ncbi:hydantoin utilization protein [Nostoc sp. T09]|uniref:HupE/UreJ family protein n=1 Tax=Nostoc sp. T09 TaxID=1932621 RepID=UPI000A3C74D1|nr:HupE/UreJ family protein [Nostoc sp. T09]OUL36665.1 hydantoin utilization protein [Nostoc sp. T09]
MLTVELSTSTRLQRRHAGAIASLVLISILSSLSGFDFHPSISNSWEGLLWGIADPVISLDRLASLVVIGLLSAGMVRGALIAAAFVSAGVFGTVMHLFQVNLVGAEIGIATSTIAFGAMLMILKQPNWLLLLLLGAIAGLFHGYAGTGSAIETGMLPLVIYVLGVTLTQCAVVMSAREMYSMLPNRIRFAGLAFSAIGIVFLRNAINLVM